MMEINKWVRAAREHKGLTQDQLGEALGRTKSNVSSWEKGLHEPSYTQLRTMARLTGYPMPDGARDLFSDALIARLRELDASEITNLEEQLRVQFRLERLPAEESFPKTTGAKTTARKSSPGAKAAPSDQRAAPRKKRAA